MFVMQAKRSAREDRQGQHARTEKEGTDQQSAEAEEAQEAATVKGTAGMDKGGSLMKSSSPLAPSHTSLSQSLRLKVKTLAHPPRP